MVPLSGRYTPAIMLNSVVLPAPFGPITANIAAFGTANVTSDTACKPLKFFETRDTSSSASMSGLPLAAAVEPERSRDRRPDPVRQQHHHQQQADAVENAL